MHTKNQPQHELGYLIGLAGVIATLLWIGIFKYTPTEAMQIKPLIENHPFMSWMYQIFSVQFVSGLIGTFEIITAFMLIVSIKKPVVGYYAGIIASFIFVVTLSFILTTPGSFKVVDGVPLTDFFLFKDIVFLGITLITVQKGYQARQHA
ncbi:DUF417 family protein [Iodobacter ciconiae]|uniref:DUF417 family protein n=1 Tax=Iodobacter ciconiae TaxID=2496266 RepID=A0A3S8ZP41_9NEIS|nr:DUF417 family protein [Iodobacter ciconiae]AZN35255.1 DUF417 family protein [Iodobacter ciconiae]